jgi:hypothetical protein
VPGKNGSREVVERAVAHSAEIALPFGLRLIVSVFDHLGSMAVGALDPPRPAELSNGLVTFSIIDQSVNVNVHPAKRKNGSSLSHANCLGYGKYRQFHEEEQDQPGNGIEPYFFSIR